MKQQRQSPGGSLHRSWRAFAARFVRAERGAVSVETAVGLVVMMTMVLVVIECCMMVYTYSVFADAARQGVRYATMHGTDSSSCSGPSTGCGDAAGDNVVSAVSDYASNYSAPISGMSISVTYPDSSSAPPSRVNVTVTYTYQSLFNVRGMSHAFTVSSEGRILY